VRDFSFTPSTLTNIPAGTSITWDWGAGPTSPHTVTFDAVANAPTDISQRTSGSVSRTYNNAGTCPYHCAIHPSMTGSVTVIP